MSTARIVASFCVAGVVLAGSTWAQTYPDRPIRLVGSLPGGGSDLVMRLIAPAMKDALGQPVVIDNRPGALLGDIGSKSPPDGYTLITVGTSFMIGHLLREQAWDPVRDFSPVTLADAGPNVLLVYPSVPVKTLKELIALAKARPGQLNYSSGPAGGIIHLAAELMKGTAGVNIVWVPYKSNGLALTSLMAGETQAMFKDAAGVDTQIRAGRVKALAVTSAQESPLFPGMPTMTASGMPGYEAVAVDAIVVPAKTPAAIIARLNQEIVRALNQPAAKDTLFKSGVIAVGGSSEELGTFIKSEISKWGKVIKDANIKAD